MDPSFVEKRFFVRSKRYVLSHLVEAYQAGLRGNLLQVPQNDGVDRRRKKENTTLHNTSVLYQFSIINSST